MKIAFIYGEEWFRDSNPLVIGGSKYIERFSAECFYSIRSLQEEIANDWKMCNNLENNTSIMIDNIRDITRKMYW